VFLHTDRQTDGRKDERTDKTKLIVVFRSLAITFQTERVGLYEGF